MAEQREVRLRVLSLGAGVQSTTLALMAAHGEARPMPDCAIFADTGAEPAPVYAHLDWLRSGVLPFPVHIVSAGNIIQDLEAAGRRRFASIPYHLASNGRGGKGIGRRQCTREYKIAPLARAQRRLLGAQPRQRLPAGCVEVWIGISTDEAVRIKPARQRWQTNRWPLIEAGMSRWDCRQWLARRGYPPPPKSACIICPYRARAEWRWLRDHDPSGFAAAVRVDAGLRASQRALQLRAAPYLHASLQPLAEVDLSTAEERGQQDLWGSECEGLCGV